MAFRQPTQSVIRTADFRDGAVHFPVESVINSLRTGSRLRLIASAGYLLTTPINKTPQPEQTLDYVLQPNGSYVAHGTVTLLSRDHTPAGGSVRLEDPLGQTLHLFVVADAGSDAAIAARPPVLIVSSEAVQFDKTAIGEESYSILRISQQHTDTPVAVTVAPSIGDESAEPARFSIATGVQQLIFTTGLNFTPAPGGTYVHLRYVPNRPGRDTARLRIETPYETKTIPLTGQTTGLLPRVVARPIRRPAPPEPELAAVAVDADEPTGAAGSPWWLRWSALLLVGGLAFAGYTYRCDLFPALCQAASVPVFTPERSVSPAPSGPTAIEATAPKSVAKTVPARRPPATTRQPVDKPARDRTASADDAPVTTRSRSRSAPTGRSASEPTERRTEDVVTTPARPRSPAPASAALTGSAPNERPAKRRSTTTAPPTVSTGESDLEQELNKKNNP